MFFIIFVCTHYLQAVSPQQTIVIGILFFKLNLKLHAGQLMRGVHFSEMAVV
jgi:hypothetical protein